MNSQFIKLSNLDRTNLAFESAKEPITILFEISFSGIFKADIIKKAWEKTVEELPLTSARISSKYFKLYWDLGHMPPIELLYFNNENLEAMRNKLISSQINLKASVVRVILLFSQNHSRLILLINHSAMDGYSGLLILYKLVSNYADLSGAGTVEELDYPKKMTSSGETFTRKFSYLPFVNKITRIHGHKNKNEGFSILFKSFDMPVLKSSVKRFSQPATINDLILYAVHKSIELYNDQFNKKSDLIITSMPINLRSHESKNILGNFSYIVPIASKYTERLSPDTLINTICYQTKAYKARPKTKSLGALENIMSARFSLKTILLIRRLFGDKLVHTSMVSNLGQTPGISIGPGLWSQDFLFSPPARMPRGAEFGIISNGDRTFITLRYANALIGREQASMLLNYVSQLLIEPIF
jgi:NRPS condensation-like uncharacterized protein